MESFRAQHGELGRTRGILDRIKLDGPSYLLAWKYPYDDIRHGAQLIVGESQQAIVVREGRHVATFGPGRHCLTTANLPIVGKLVALAFGGQTPFPTEVWLFNTSAAVAVNFGTPAPLYVRDERLQAVVRLRAYGQMTVRVADCGAFLRKFAGATNRATADAVQARFRATIAAKLQAAISAAIVDERVSVVEIAAMLDRLSKRCHDLVRAEVGRFGLAVESLRVADVSFFPGSGARTTIRFRCKCGAKYKARGKYAGRPARCARCGRVVVVPHAADRDAGSARGVKSAAKRAAGWRRDTAHCPQCGAPVAALTSICAYCGTLLPRRRGPNRGDRQG